MTFSHLFFLLLVLLFPRTCNVHTLSLPSPPSFLSLSSSPWHVWPLTCVSVNQAEESADLGGGEEEEEEEGERKEEEKKKRSSFEPSFPSSVSGDIWVPFMNVAEPDEVHIMKKKSNFRVVPILQYFTEEKCCHMGNAAQGLIPEWRLTRRDRLTFL